MCKQYYLDKICLHYSLSCDSAHFSWFYNEAGRRPPHCTAPASDTCGHVAATQVVAVSVSSFLGLLLGPGAVHPVLDPLVHLAHYGASADFVATERTGRMGWGKYY